MMKELWLTWIFVSGLRESATTKVQGPTNLTVVIDGYTVNSTLTSPATLPLGRTALLVCRVSGIPHGKQTSYQWTCPNQPCMQTGCAGRKINNNIVAINTTSTSDGGTYTCTVTAGGMNTTQDFRIKIEGGAVVHSYGRLLVHEAVITDKRQLQHPNDDTGNGKIECTISSGMNKNQFGLCNTNSGNSQKATAVIQINKSKRCDNTEGQYGNAFLYLFLNSSNGFPQVRYSTLLTASTQSITATMEFTYDNTYGIGRVITGYHRLDLGHEMVGQFHNNEKIKTVTFSGLVPGARYRITAWGLGGGDNRKRGSAPAVLEVTTEASVPSTPRALTITRIFEDGIELHWLPPRETNGDIRHYIIRYTLQNGTAQEITTTDNTHYYNLTGLEGGQIYYNFAVKAVNSAGVSEQSTSRRDYTKSSSPTIKPTTSTTNTTLSTGTEIITGAGIGVVAVLAGVLLAVIIVICCIVAVMRRRKKNNANSTVQSDTTPHCSTDREQEHVYTTSPGDHKPVVSFTSGALYDEVEISAQPTPVAVPSAAEYEQVDFDKEEDGEGKCSTGITNPEDFYAQPDKKGKKRQDLGDYELPEQHIPNPDCLYSSVKKKKKNKSDKKVKITEGPKLGQHSMLYEEVDRTQKMKTKHPHNTPPQDNAIYAEVNKPKKKKGKKNGEASEVNNGTQELGELVPTVPPRGNDLGYEPSADSMQ